MMIMIIMNHIVMITGKKDNSSDKNKISYNYKCII